MINRQTLQEAGFRKFITPDHRTLFQKRVRDEKGTRYFIDVYEYDWVSMGINHPTPVSYEAQVHLYKGVIGESLMRVTVMDENANRSVDALEEFIDRLWDRMDAGYYS